MEADNCKVLEIEPSGIELVVPVVHEAIDNGDAVQLGADSVKDEARIDR